MTFDQVIGEIIALIDTHTQIHMPLLSEPLERLRGLTDAIEVFIARPLRRPLTDHELSALLHVRYIRVIEDNIALGELRPMRPEEYTMEELIRWGNMEAVVREAWDRRENEYTGPTPEEVQRNIWFRTPTPQSQQQQQPPE